MVSPLVSVVDLLIEAESAVLCSCVTISLWLSSDWLSSPEEQILVTVVLVMVVRVDTALLSVVDTTGAVIFNGALAIFISVETTVVVVVEVVVTWVIMVLSGSVVPL